MRALVLVRPLLGCCLLLLALPAPARPQQAADTATLDAQARQLTVAALELPGRDDAQWKQRREQVAQLLTELQPDVISVQQVRQQQGRNPACWLANRLRYSCDFVTADPPSQPLRHGNAMLTRLPVSEDGVTLLHPPGTFSAAGMMRLRLGEALVNVYVTRLRPEPDEAAARQHQTSDLMAWISATAEGLPSVIAGDFSAGTVELVRATPGFQPARRSPGGRAEASASGASGASGHGLDVLFQVKHFGGIRQQPILLPADGELPGLRLGMMATLRLQGDTATAE
ncbi:endonuclease/exonuclease/phosphatase family protein [Stenotrophomonas sp. MA5]|jgi:endonuclease/exonuclease/phosphatase family metal-dependent hydrolase|uniref:endonuclease/exonuclease/phosphatase family protein n=2 Tax=unclassified Stenotrophomonas TaxID=196198 RepID=UPI001009FDAE|nr:endonuclease/exonuclease/phosphatase family protein [Stenotrophomonas sp. MA5]RXK69472.1 endonuclease/exonuclease/phosphatase family protein [Stenotrophomonas sp. MA5]